MTEAAVREFFDSLTTLMPKYVSPRSANRAALLAGAATLAAASPLVYTRARVLLARAPPQDQLVATGVLFLVFLAVSQVVGRVHAYVLTRDMIRANSMHLALEQWIPRYVRALASAR